MATAPVLISNQGAVDAPNQYTVPAGLDFEPTAVTAVFDGTAAASAFRPVLSFYAQSGELIARTFPSDTIAAGGSAEVTYSPFPNIASSAAPTTTNQEWTAPVHIDVLTWRQASNNLQTNGAVTFTVDNTYPYGAYCETTADGDYMSWIIDLGPRYSIWSYVPMVGGGADYGKIDVDFATVPYLPYDPFNGDLDHYSDLTFHTLETVDPYNAATQKPYSASVFREFRINGAAGTVGTGFTANITGWYDWDGGPGPMRVRLKTNGKNGASGGYRKRVISLAFYRVDDHGLP